MYGIIEPLFSDTSILTMRIGAEKFNAIPQLPGIYRFYGTNGEMLYVGKAKNLRRRIFSYKRVKSGSVSRKVSKLIANTTSFDFLVTNSESEALLLENLQIRQNRPPYNHANKETETYYFVYLKTDASGLKFRLAMRIHDNADTSYWHGCFKGHLQVRKSFGCLLRLIWMAEHGIQNPMLLPVLLNRNLTPMNYYLPWKFSSENASQHDLVNLINTWVKGENCEILDWFVVQIEGGEKLTPFQSLFLEYHIETLKLFFEKKLVKHKEIRGNRTIILQDELDDLLIA